MRPTGLGLCLLLSGFTLMPTAAVAQQAAEPAPPAAGDLPAVDVVQKPKAKAVPAKAASKKAPAKKKAVAKSAPPPPTEPVPQPPPAAEFEPAETTGATPNAAQYPTGGQGAAARAYDGALSPVDPTKGIVPGNLDRYPGAATRIDSTAIDAQRPFSTNDVLERVPGVSIVNDDGFARHGGIGIRGSPARRSRKVLVLEDGFPVNMSLYIDPSTHYIPPSDRIQSVEVLRGANAAYGPNNNHGVVNFVNLSPFGANETELEFSFGTGGSNTRHMHTRQGFGNVGVVASYSGANVDGTWNTERLRYNDFYGAIGWKGVDQDFVISGMYNRQRDNYDEANLEGEDDFELGDVERLFYNEIGHCKTCFNPGSIFNTYNADIVRLQAVHNYYFDRDTTLSTRLYGSYHRRDRYQNFDEEGPLGDDVIPGQETEIEEPDPGEFGEVLVPDGSMLGRLRTYKTYGADTRAEFANRQFFGGLRQDLQVGAKYEFNDFTNRNFFGASGEILEDGDKDGTYIFDREYDAHAMSAFIQSVIHVTPDLKVVPGVRLEHYRISRFTRALTTEEGEGEPQDECEGDIEGPCQEIGSFSRPFNSEDFDRTNVLPHLSFAWSGLRDSTIYGGYHQGLTMHVLREETIPPGEEIGDNFQLGFRSKAIRGLTFDVAGFYSAIDDYQIKGASTTADGNNVFSTAEKVEIKGVEIEGRVDSRAYHGGPWNFYSSGVYTYSNSKIRKGFATPESEEEEEEEEEEEGEPVNLKGNGFPRCRATSQPSRSASRTPSAST